MITPTLDLERSLAAQAMTLSLDSMKSPRRARRPGDGRVRRHLGP